MRCKFDNRKLDIWEESVSQQEFTHWISSVTIFKHLKMQQILPCNTEILGSFKPVLTHQCYCQQIACIQKTKYSSEQLKIEQIKLIKSF